MEFPHRHFSITLFLSPRFKAALHLYTSLNATYCMIKYGRVFVFIIIPDSAMLALRSSEEESPEMEDMDTSEPNWCWFYLAECGVWHMFEVVTGQLKDSKHTFQQPVYMIPHLLPFPL